MSNRRGMPANRSDPFDWSGAVARIRSRRIHEDADALLDESLALLDRIVGAPLVPGMHILSASDDDFPEIDGVGLETRRLKQHMLRVARDPDVTVLISGESGTGKELVARAIHRASPRSRCPFGVVNCAGLSPTLIEDELFGHVRGAFTGAVEAQPGPFERANGGTVLLDEIGDLSTDLQMKLLRALQQRTVQRLGSRDETSFDVRVIAATNVDLAGAVARRRFRADLYYRLKVYELVVPPLRRRGAGDIHALANAILARLAKRRRRSPPTVHSEVLDRLVRYKWPGNVRELENTLEYMIVSAGRNGMLTLEHLPEDFGSPVDRSAPNPRPTPPSVARVISALEANNSRSGRAAADLGLSRHQLYRLLKRHGVRSPRARE
jgi:Nif-specific regulatory protein